MSGEELLVEPFAITLFLGIFSLISLYWYTTLNFDYWKKRGIPYVTPTLPFLGSLFPLFWKVCPSLSLLFYPFMQGVLKAFRQT
ncbi:hypothetical protein AVEN_243244-1 [Araneus ventricosus]|uniref:Uncharacterized protein n=1 Tax=Araneus ventricosus TaxID=182803 RepID=A0A4Y2UVR5_ARAVE|nr:hypothetical protein AVEN_243244-1 [Araneus ventricosus]